MDKRLFSNKHIWICFDGEVAKIGISDYAQEKLGSIMFLNLPDLGEEIKKDQRFGDIESIKTVADLYSPIDGKVISVNENLSEEPEAINENPYESWFIEVKFTSIPNNLMDEETYLKNNKEF